MNNKRMYAFFFILKNCTCQIIVIIIIILLLLLLLLIIIISLLKSQGYLAEQCSTNWADCKSTETTTNQIERSMVFLDKENPDYPEKNLSEQNQ